MTEAAVLAPYLALGNALRGAGVPVGTGQQTAFARGVAALDATDATDLYWTGRACLVSRSSDIEVYDRVFAQWLSAGGTELRAFGVPPTGRGAAAAGRPAVVGQATAQRREDRHGLLASQHEALRHKDFADCTAEELAVISRLVADLRLVTPLRSSRRSDLARNGRRPDLRGALRDAVREQSSPGRLRFRTPRRRRRPLLLLVDVSGSMSAYSRTLVQFAWSARQSTDRVEVFCFGTRLTRVTRALARHDVGTALRDAADAVLDWDGGTRIGASVHELLRRHARRAGCRGAAVVICSDGLERGDPEELSAGLARLRRLSHRVVWVNPLSGDPAFEPVTRGMSVALPHVDAVVAGHSLASLEELRRVVAELA